MKRARKRKRAESVLPWLLMMAAAVALGLCMPGLVTRIQSTRTDNTREYVDLGSSMLSITSDSAKLEKLGILSGENSYHAVTVSNGQNMTGDEALDMLYAVPRLIEGTGLPYTQFGKGNLEYMETQLLVSDSTDVTTTIIWMVNLSKRENDCYYNLSYAVDDATGLILAVVYFEVPDAYDKEGTNQEEWPSEKEDSSEAVRRIAENLTEMYKFTNTTAELDNSVSIGDNYRYSINFYTDGSRELTMPVYIGDHQWMINAC